MRTLLPPTVLLVMGGFWTAPMSHAGYVLEWIGPESFTCHTSAPAHQPAIDPATQSLDMDGDGRTEILLRAGNMFQWYDGRTYQLEWEYVTAGSFWGFHDLDGDGTKEAVFEIPDGRTRVQIVDWQTSTVEFTIDPGPSYWVWMCGVRDTDADGKTEIIVLVENHDPPGDIHVEVWGDGPPGTTAVQHGAIGRASSIRNLPNPFVHGTRIIFTLETASDVKLSIYDGAGRHVATLLEEHLAAGIHEAEWRGTDAAGRRVPAGVYFQALTVNDRLESRKSILLN